MGRFSEFSFSFLLFIFINLANGYLFSLESRRRPEGLHLGLSGREPIFGTCAPDGVNRTGPWWICHSSIQNAPSSISADSALKQARPAPGDPRWAQKSKGEMTRFFRWEGRRGRVWFMGVGKSRGEARLAAPRSRSPATRKALEVEQFMAQWEKPTWAGGITYMNWFQTQPCFESPRDPRPPSEIRIQWA